MPNNSDCGLSMRDDNLSSNSDPSYRLVGSSAPEGAGFGRLASSKTLETIHQMSCVARKPVVGVSDHVRHKPGCTATEDDEMLEISELRNRGIEQ